MSFNPNAVAGNSDSSFPAGTIVDYVEFNTDVAISTTSAATATVVVTGAGFTPNGVDSYMIEFFCVCGSTGASVGSALIFCLYDNGSIISAPASGTEGRIAQLLTPAGASFTSPVIGKRKVTPTNALHTYSVRCYRVVANGSVLGTASGTGSPGYIQITKAA